MKSCLQEKRYSIEFVELSLIINPQAMFERLNKFPFEYPTRLHVVVVVIIVSLASPDLLSVVNSSNKS